VPILILRYDPKDRPPPGAREMGVQNPWLLIARDYTAEICKHNIYIVIIIRRRRIVKIIVIIIMIIIRRRIVKIIVIIIIMIIIRRRRIVKIIVIIIIMIIIIYIYNSIYLFIYIDIK
jgi:hypothetical protein